MLGPVRLSAVRMEELHLFTRIHSPRYSEFSIPEEETAILLRGKVKEDNGESEEAEKDYLLFYDLIFHIAALVSLSSLSVFLRFLFSF